MTGAYGDDTRTRLMGSEVSGLSGRIRLLRIAHVHARGNVSTVITGDRHARESR